MVAKEQRTLHKGLNITCRSCGAQAKAPSLPLVAIVSSSLRIPTTPATSALTKWFVWTQAVIKQKDCHVNPSHGTAFFYVFDLSESDEAGIRKELWALLQESSVLQPKQCAANGQLIFSISSICHTCHDGLLLCENPLSAYTNTSLYMTQEKNANDTLIKLIFGNDNQSFPQIFAMQEVQKRLWYVF